MPESWIDDLCGRCLTIVDTRTAVQAHGRDDELPVDFPLSATLTQRLRAWVEEQMWGNGKMISIDAQPNAFRPVSTWHGDPVCEFHLRECRDRELRHAR